MAQPPVPPPVTLPNGATVYGDHVSALARYMAVTSTDTIEFLMEVDRRWPSLTFNEFAAACVLCATFSSPVAGHC
jgi:hypothetical protein